MTGVMRWLPHLYMVDLMSLGPALPWSLVTKGVVTRGGTWWVQG